MPESERNWPSLGESVSAPGDEQHLLWTGGWDSTFQLLRLLILDRHRVAPFYLIDARRDSLRHELRAIARIRERITREHPDTKELIQPMRFYALEDIPPDPEITEAYLLLSEDNHVGFQYEWLARFCKHNGIADMQLCIDAGESRAFRRLKDLVTEVDARSRQVYRIDPEHATKPEYVVFRFFTLPVFSLSKLDMLASAQDHGWHDIMRMTWFCHYPVGDAMPCGQCFPCISVLEEGLGWRIPLYRRIVTALPRAIRRMRR